MYKSLGVFVALTEDGLWQFCCNLENYTGKVKTKTIKNMFLYFIRNFYETFYLRARIGFARFCNTRFWIPGFF